MKKTNELIKELKTYSTKILEVAETLASMFPDETEDTKPLTLDEVRGKLTDLARAGYTDDIKEIIRGYGVERLSDINAADYADVLAKAEKIGGGK